MLLQLRSIPWLPLGVILPKIIQRPVADIEDRGWRMEVAIWDLGSGGLNRILTILLSQQGETLLLDYLETRSQVSKYPISSLSILIKFEQNEFFLKISANGNLVKENIEEVCTNLLLSQPWNESFKTMS